MQVLQKPSNRGGRDCAEEVMSAVPPVVWYMRRQMRGNRGKLSLPQFRALVRIERDPSASMTAIAEHLGVSLSTTSRVISGLVRRGYLARQMARLDRRQARLAITAKGGEVLRTARGATRQSLGRVLQNLMTRDRDVVIEAMRILRDLFIAAPHSDPAARNGVSNGRNGKTKSLARDR
jgi:DNA-binding MarR family transcriptional regulator